MGVSLEWKPVDPKAGFGFEGGSRLHKILEDEFGGYPITLGENEFNILVGIRACGYEGVQDLIDAVSEHGRIEIDCNW